MFSHFLPPPQHPPLVGPSFLFLFLPQRGFFFFSFGATLLLELQAWRLLFFFSSPFLFSSSFLLSYFSKRVLFAVGVSFENRVTPFSFFSFSLSLFFSPPLSRKREQRLTSGGEGSVRTSNGNGGLSLPGTKGARENSPPGSLGCPIPKKSLWDGSPGESLGTPSFPNTGRGSESAPSPARGESWGWGGCSSLNIFFKWADGLEANVAAEP